MSVQQSHILFASANPNNIGAASSLNNIVGRRCTDIVGNSKRAVVGQVGVFKMLVDGERDGDHARLDDGTYAPVLSCENKQC